MAKRKAPAALIREATGLDIKNFAIETGISRPTVYSLEAGGPCSEKTLAKFRQRWKYRMAKLRIRGEDLLRGSLERR